MPKQLSRYNRAGRAKMPYVSAKSPIKRSADASAFLVLKPAVLTTTAANGVEMAAPFAVSIAALTQLHTFY
jgi:molybdenum cofactor biosynthesis enzyme